MAYSDWLQDIANCLGAGGKFLSPSWSGPRDRSAQLMQVSRLPKNTFYYHMFHVESGNHLHDQSQKQIEMVIRRL